MKISGKEVRFGMHGDKQPIYVNVNCYFSSSHLYGCWNKLEWTNKWTGYITELPSACIMSSVSDTNALYRGNPTNMCAVACMRLSFCVRWHLSEVNKNQCGKCRLYIPPTLTFSYYVFCTKSVFMGFV
jgi:hypothetical protein